MNPTNEGEPMNRLAARFNIWLTTAHDDRGDVPGWVLVTVMTAGLVTALWFLADVQLKSVLTNAMNSVTR
jgi:hypothetical protein